MDILKCVFNIILCHSVGVSSASSSSSSSSSGTNGGLTSQFAQTQNTFPGPGLGYNYGNVYPAYPLFNGYGNQVPAGVSLNNRNSFEEDVPVVARTQLYVPNSLAAPLDYGLFLNNYQQQQNAYV